MEAISFYYTGSVILRDTFNDMLSLCFSNYFGESTLWTGIATTAAGVMLSNVGQAGMGSSGNIVARLGALAMAGVSPAFVTFLLLKV